MRSARQMRATTLGIEASTLARETVAVKDSSENQATRLPAPMTHPAGFDTIMPKTLATPAVDRLLHHAHLILTEVPSRRLAEAAAGKGVKPLT